MAVTKKDREAMGVDTLIERICEESGELIQAACKLRRFGPAAEFAGVKYDNIGDMLEEFRQLRGFVTEVGKRLQRKTGRTKRRIRTPAKKKASPVRKAC